MTITTDGLLIFDDKTMLTSYGIGEDQKSIITFSSSNKNIKIVGNAWKKFDISGYQITKNTILSFYYKSSVQGEIQAIGLDNDNTISPDYIFQLYGTEDYGNQNTRTYAPSDWKSYLIPVGHYLADNVKYVTFINDQDIDNPTAESYFYNIHLTEKLVLKSDLFKILEDTSITITTDQLLSNDIGTLLKVTNVSSPNTGSVVFQNEKITFTPNPNFAGLASFKYTVTDRNGKKASSIAKISVAAVNDLPIAVDDSLSTPQNVPLSVPVSQLLSNDSDVDGNLLTLTGVKGAINGNVVLSGSNVIFTSLPGFSGQASFNYTISDGRGGTDTATVTVNNSTPPTSSARLGTNLAGISDWSTQLPFIDGFRNSRYWITQKPGVWDTGEAQLLNLDANGWVKSLPAPEASPEYTDVSTVLYTVPHYPGGKYTVLYDGEGTIEYHFGAKKDFAASKPGRDVLEVTPTNGGIYAIIKATDPNKTGNYIRNIRVVPEAYEKTYDTQLFNPTFLEKTAPYGALRFMDWMATNNSTQSQWSDRPTYDDPSWSWYGAPVEVMVELANRLDRDPWFCMPHKATDDYVKNFAQYVKNHLEPERKVYIEYSNEVWNWAFQQTAWADAQAKATGLENYIDWYSKRTTEVTRMWDQVWGTQKERVIGVMAAQAANSWVGERALTYAWDTTPKSNEYYGIDAIAIAPYFGYYLGSPDNAVQVEGWTKAPDGGLNKLFDELTKGGVLSNSPVGGAVQESFRWMSSYATLADKENLQLIAYEGGQHITGFYGAENNQAMTDLFIAANRDPRMGEIYKQYLSKWYALGGDLFMNFSDVVQPSKWGSWGALEYIDQNSSPKYDALMDVIESFSTSVS